MAKYKRKFDEPNFEDAYSEFEDELRDNVDEYQDIKIVYDYLNASLGMFYKWNPFDPGDNLHIILQNYEVSFLINPSCSKFA